LTKHSARDIARCNEHTKRSGKEVSFIQRNRGQELHDPAARRVVGERKRHDYGGLPAGMWTVRHHGYVEWSGRPPGERHSGRGGSDNCLPQKLTIPGGSVVTLTFAGVINPPRGTNHALTVSTTASPVPVTSDPFTIGDNTLEWLSVNVARPLAAIKKLLEGVNERLDDKIALEKQLLDELDDLADVLLDMHDYLQEKLQIEWELLDVVDEILVKVPKKIDLEIAIHNALDVLERCLRQLEPTGTLTPPAEPRSPIDVVLALDSSESMEDNDPKRIAISGAKVFVDKLDPARDRVGVASWDDGVDFTKALSSAFAQVKRDLDGVDQDGGTDFDVGLKAALDLLKAASPGGPEGLGVLDGRQGALHPTWEDRFFR